MLFLTFSKKLHPYLLCSCTSQSHRYTNNTDGIPYHQDFKYTDRWFNGYIFTFCAVWYG